MKTQLIIMTSLAGVYQSSGSIDLYDDIPISLNYSIADIKEPEKRNADYSKTITAPGTNNNNKLLSHIYEIGIDRQYNPNKKVEARILYDSVMVMKGFIRLVKIRTLRDHKIEYDFEIKGRLDDLFINIKDKKLTDLTWTDLDHVYSKTNIKNSWTATVGYNYVYPFIDYGYSINKVDYLVNHFAPAVYVKEIWDRIFSYAGFQYTSTFLTADFFKRLIIPFTSDKMRLSESQVNLRQFRASRVTSTQIAKSFPVNNNIATYFYPTVEFNNDSTSPNEDTGNNYSTATFKYTVPANGYYTFTSQLLLSVTNVSGNGGMNVTGWARVIKGSAAKMFERVNILTPGFPTQTLNISYTSFLVTGDVIYIDLQVNTGSPNSGDLNVLVNSYFFVKVTPDLQSGDTIPFVNTIPQKIKMSEFLLAIIKLFNLYIEYDKDTPNKLRIEPRNDFYNSTAQDWSNKLDPTREPEITPMGALDAKRYIFRYKKDNDWLNSIYQSTYGQGTDSTYGERLKDVDNDFLKNDNVMESIFSPTPLYSDSVSDRVYPLIEKVDSKTQVISQIQANVRILYYGGLKTCQSWDFSDTTNLTRTAETQYPYCGHLDDAAAPTIDLSFGVPKEVYYLPAWNATYTNNNLYNKYWRQFIEEITDYNSSLVTAWFWLRPADIAEVDFRHIYRFKNQHFRLNKIYDYNPSAKSLTKCEFLKLKAGRPFVAKTKIFTGGHDAVFALQMAAAS